MYLLPISVQYLQFLSQDMSELGEGEVLICNNKMQIWGETPQPGQSQVITNQKLLTMLYSNIPVILQPDNLTPS